jgi:hypothetical protein
MELPKTLTAKKPVIRLENVEPSALERLNYLCPSRYFRFYMLHEREDNRTCWLPEGYEC